MKYKIIILVLIGILVSSLCSLNCSGEPAVVIFDCFDFWEKMEEFNASLSENEEVYISFPLVKPTEAMRSVGLDPRNGLEIMISDYVPPGIEYRSLISVDNPEITDDVYEAFDHPDNRCLFVKVNTITAIDDQMPQQLLEVSGIVSIEECK